jgi:predicted metalloprotease with PDZ domain
LNTPGRNYQSLTESSFDAWIKYYRRHENSSNSTISYYTQGGTTAAMMNLDLLNRSSGAKSLDDLMKYLYQKFLADGKGLTDEELQSAFETVWGISLDQFFDQYICGTAELPYAEYCQYAGLNLVRTDGKAVKPGYTGASFSMKGNQLLITGVRRGSPAWVDGLNVNDEIITVDTARAASVKAYLDTKMPGDEVLFTIMRSGESRVVMVTLGEDPNMSLVFENTPKPAPLQRKVRKGWLINGK